MSNQPKKHFPLIPCVLTLMLAAFLVFSNKPSVFVANAQSLSDNDLRRDEFVPEHIIYRTLFHTIFLLNQEVDKAERAGRIDSARAFRRAFRQDAELSDEQAAILNRTAAEYEQAVGSVDAKARKIIEARRANYPDSKLRAGQQPLPPSLELAALQRTRDALVLHYRANLREAFGENEWQRFVQSIPPRVAAGIGASGAKSQNAPVVFLESTLKTPRAAQVQAESVITGSTLVSYDAFSNIVTAVSTTELDYAAQDWYTGRVTGHIRDAGGSLLANVYASDTDHDGTVSVTAQTTGQDQMIYSARGYYGAYVDIQDPSLGRGGYYIDHYNFQSVHGGGEGGGTYFLYVPFYAYGPSRSTQLQSLSLGATSPITIQAKGEVKSKPPTLTDNDINVESAVSTKNESTDVVTVIEASTLGLEDTDRVVVEVITTTGNGAAINWSNGQVSEPVVIAPGRNTSVSIHINSVTQAGTYVFRTRIADVQRRNPDGTYRSIYNTLTINMGGEYSSTLTVRN